MAIVIENSKQTLDHSSAPANTIKKQAKFNYCRNLHAYFGKAIIGFLVMIFLTFAEKKKIESNLNVLNITD